MIDQSFAPLFQLNSSSLPLSFPKILRVLGLGALSVVTAARADQVQGQEAQTPKAQSSDVEVDRHQRDELSRPLERSAVVMPFERVVSQGPDAIQQIREEIVNPEALILSYGESLQRPTPLHAQCLLADGSLLHFPYAQDDKLRWGGTQLLAGEGGFRISIPTSNVKAFRPQPDSRYSAAWGRALTKEVTRDVLVVRREGGALDTLEGTIVAVDAEQVSFKMDNEEFHVPFAKIEGFLCYTQKQKSEAGQMELQTEIGTLICNDFKLQEGAQEGMVAASSSGTELTGPLTPFRLNRIRIAAKTLAEVSTFVELWAPVSEENFAAPLGLVGVPTRPFEVVPGDTFGQCTLNGSTKIKVHLRGEFGRMYVASSDGEDALRKLSFSSDGAPLTPLLDVSHTQRPVLTLDLSEVKTLSIELSDRDSVVLDTLLFVHNY